MYGQLTSWNNLLLAYQRAAIGKRGQPNVAAFERYVDDMLLFADDKSALWGWRAAVVERLARLRLTIHPGAHPRPVTEGIPFLGFVLYPTHRLLKRRKVVHFRRRLKEKIVVYQAGDCTAAEVGVSVRSWLNHARYGDTWGLRRAILREVVL